MSTAWLVLLELDPNIVRPGWTPLLILIALGAVVYLLFRSMRRQFRKVDAHFGADEPAAEQTERPTAEPDEAGRSPRDGSTAG